MTAILDEKELNRDVRRFMRFVRPDLDTSEVSLINHLVFFPAAIVGKMLFDRLRDMQDLQLLDRLTTGQLDDEASNYGLVRKEGTRARVDVVFFTLTLPVADIVIPAGTLVSTVPFSLGRAISYRTLATRRLLSGSGAQSFFVTDHNRWESDPVPAEAVEPGLDSVLGENRISVIQGTVAGIDGVYNPRASSTATDAESDDRLRERIARKRLGAERNLRRGLESYLLNTYSFVDAAVIRVDDPDSERSDGVDVFVIDDSVTEISETLAHALGKDVYSLSSRPVLEVLGIAGTAGATLIDGTDFYFERDVSFTQRLSAKSSDRIRLTIEGHQKLADGEPFVVLYTYSPVIANAQADIDTDATQILTANPLIKKATRFDLEVRAAVTFFAGAGDVNEQKERIRLALVNFFDAFRLGTPIQGSDVIGVIQFGLSGFTIQSVDQVVLRDVIATSEYGEVRKLSDDPNGEQIQFNEKEYCRLATVTFTTIT